MKNFAKIFVIITIGIGIQFTQQAKWLYESCTFWWIFGQQITIPHFSGSVPTLSDLWTYMFSWYIQWYVQNASQCNNQNINSISTGNNTYVYCKHGILKDRIAYNVTNTEQNLNTNIYISPTCQQTYNNCYINNTVILNWESKVFYENGNSTSSICNSQIRTCNNWILSWSFIYDSCQNYNGLCGAVSNQYISTLPTVNLCSAGSTILNYPNFNITTNQWNRVCSWISGSSEICTAYKKQDEQTIGICREYNSWMATDNINSSSNNSPTWCVQGNPTQFQETNLWRQWKCTTEYGSSNLCSASKAIEPKWTITYTTNRDESVTASVINIQPYGTYINNNNNSNSKIFNQNGSFKFELKFNNIITYLTASVSTINQRSLLIKNLILDYNNNICEQNKFIKLWYSNQYSVLDMQTLVNHCLLIPNKTKNSYSIKPNKIISRGEFVKSLYNFIKTIRPYYNNIYNLSQTYKYTGIGTKQEDINAIKRLISIQWDQYLQSTKKNNIPNYKWNNAISTKEIFNLTQYVLNLHDDNSISYESIWERENIWTTMIRQQYARIMRKVLEEYDRIALGNNIDTLQSIQNRIINISTANQSNELKNIYSQLHLTSHNKFENYGISKRVLLQDISNLYLNNSDRRKKSIITVYLQDIVNKIPSISSINTQNIFKQMNY